jgi:hypothetical protein
MARPITVKNKGAPGMFSDKWKTFIDPFVLQPYEEKDARELQVGDILVYPEYPMRFSRVSALPMPE